jgi:hypothetical protein
LSTGSISPVTGVKDATIWVLDIPLQSDWLPLEDQAYGGIKTALFRDLNARKNFIQFSQFRPEFRPGKASQ